jgi:ATP-dependent Clp protease protease subunit
MTMQSIYITGLIGTIYDSQGNVSQKGVELIDIIKQVKGYSQVDGFNVYINSEGGVFETGFEIYDYLEALKKGGKIINTIGIEQVASIATVPFMAGVNRTLRPNTNFLIHSPMLIIDQTMNASNLEEAIALLQPIEKKLIDFYKKTTGLMEAEILPLVKKETSLNPSDAYDLKFATEYQAEFTKAVAYLKRDNLNNNNQMTENDKSWLDNLISNAVAKIKGTTHKKSFKVIALKKGKIVNVDVTDANGTVIVFAEVADGVMPMEGDMGTIDGAPAVGEYLMPDGTTYLMDETGMVTQVVMPTEGAVVDVEEVDNLKAEILTLQEEIASLKDQLASQTTNYTSEIVNLKKQVTSRFQTVDQKTHNRVEQTTNKRKLLKD